MMDPDIDGSDLSWREKLRGLYRVASFRPLLTWFVILFSVFVAFFEGVGLGFLLPIIEVAGAEGDPAASASGALLVFVEAYKLLGIPFTMEYLIGGVTAVMTVRYASSFVAGWLRVILKIQYVKHLQTRAFENALGARVSYFDREGSDDIINAVVTQAELAGKVIRDFTHFFRLLMLSLVYVSIAVYISWELTLFATVFFAVSSYGVRSVLAPGYELGDHVAEANERIQGTVQSGAQAVRDVKLYTMTDDVLDQFSTHIDRFTSASIDLGRNEEAINNFYRLITATMLFVMIYGAVEVAGLALSSLGVFLFALFRLGPRVSSLNTRFYKFEGRLPHLVRTQEFIADLEEKRELPGGDREVPDPPMPVAFEDVSFAYEDEQVLREVSFEIPPDGFVAFVGQSGAGKSTIVSLLARLYDPDSGRVTAAGVPIDEFDLTEWRRRVAVVRQDPHIFNNTLEHNVAIGDPDADREEIERVCELARVTEFVDDLPDGYRTELGDDGVRLSGGQRQRVALARGLLKDADLLVLDEATSDLDRQTEREVQDALEGIDRDYPIVAIAHRLSTVRNADRIFALEDGQIVERGRHEDLIDEGGTYGALYAED